MRLAKKIPSRGYFGTIIFGIIIYASGVMWSGIANGDDPSSQPYIDQVKRQLEKEGKPTTDTGGTPYIDSLKQRLGPEKETGQSYIESLKAQEPKKLEGQPQEPYSETEKQKLPPKEEGGAIQAFKEGRTELKPKKIGEPHRMFGIRYSQGGLLTRNITGSSSDQLRNFNDVYGANYSPEVTLFFEYQPFRSKLLGNVGIIGVTGVSYFTGKGQFAYPLTQPNGTPFSAQSQTQFQFFIVPATLGLSYRFNPLGYFHPFVWAGPSFIAYVENRNDNVSGNKGYSLGYQFSGGIALSLDWIFPGNSWDLYEDYKIHNFYLTAEYSRLATFNGDVNFGISGFVFGFAYAY